MEIARFTERFARDAPDAIIYADAQGLIQFWNRSAERIFGFPEAEALGKTLDIIIPGSSSTSCTWVRSTTRRNWLGGDRSRFWRMAPRRAGRCR